MTSILFKKLIRVLFCLVLLGGSIAIATPAFAIDDSLVGLAAGPKKNWSASYIINDTSGEPAQGGGPGFNYDADLYENIDYTQPNATPDSERCRLGVRKIDVHDVVSATRTPCDGLNRPHPTCVKGQLDDRVLVRNGIEREDEIRSAKESAGRITDLHIGLRSNRVLQPSWILPYRAGNLLASRSSR